MYSKENYFRLISKPVELHWLGWKTDTATLAQYGWDLSANQNIFRNTMQIALRRKFDEHNQIQGISEIEEWDYHRHSAIIPRGQVLQMRLGHQFQMVSIRMNDADWNAIDANPSYTTQRIENLEDIVHFKKVNQDTKEILLQRASLEEVLRFALDKQADRQDHIRKEMMKRKELEQYKQNSKLHTELRLVA